MFGSAGSIVSTCGLLPDAAECPVIGGVPLPGFTGIGALQHSDRRFFVCAGVEHSRVSRIITSPQPPVLGNPKRSRPSYRHHVLFNALPSAVVLA